MTNTWALAALLTVASPVLAAPEPGPQDGSKYRAAAVASIATLIEKGTDRYGTVRSPIWVLNYDEQFSAFDGRLYEVQTILPMWPNLHAIRPQVMRPYLEQFWALHTDPATGQVDRHHNTGGHGLGFDSFFLAMEELTGDKAYRDTARQVADEALGHLGTGGLLKGFSDRRHYSAIEGAGYLAQALIELDADPATLRALRNDNPFLWNL